MLNNLLYVIYCYLLLLVVT